MSRNGKKPPKLKYIFVYLKINFGLLPMSSDICDPGLCWRWRADSSVLLSRAPVYCGKLPYVSCGSGTLAKGRIWLTNDNYIPRIRRIGGCYGFTSKPPAARNGVNAITQKPLDGLFSNLVYTLVVIVSWPDSLFKVVGQRSRSQRQKMMWFFRHFWIFIS